MGVAGFQLPFALPPCARVAGSVSVIQREEKGWQRGRAHCSAVHITMDDQLYALLLQCRLDAYMTSFTRMGITSIDMLLTPFRVRECAV